MPKIAYSGEDREQIREALVTAGLDLFTKQGIQHTTVEQIYTRVGISRTFFYTFFSSKEELVLQAFYRQRPILIEHAHRLMEASDMDWRVAIRKFFHDSCQVGEKRIAIMTSEDQRINFPHLSPEKQEAFREGQLQFFSELLGAFSVRVDRSAARFLWNFVLSTVIIRRAVPDTLPFLFPEAADELLEFQIDTFISCLEKYTIKGGNSYGYFQ